MNRYCLVAIMLALLPSLGALASPLDEPWAGDGMRVELQADGASAFAGVIDLNGRVFPVQLKRDGERRLVGSFDVDGHAFPVTITQQNDTTLIVESQGGRFVLHPVDAPPNPGNPLLGNAAAPAAPTPSPAGESTWSALGGPRLSPARQWTMLLYLDGDNNLEAAALADLDELESVAGSPSVDVLVLIDRAEGFDDSCDNWTGTRLYRITPDQTNGHIGSELVLDLGEQDMSDPKLLTQAINSVFTTWPAEHTALVMWDHGSGWASHCQDVATEAAGGHGHMSMPQTRGAIAQGIKAAGLGRLDLVGFDMCLMGELETAIALDGLADVIVFSQAIEPGFGWPYNTIMPQFAQDTMGARRLGQDIVQRYGEFYERQGTPGTTQSAVNVDQAKAVQEALSDLAEALQPAVAQHWPTMARTIYYSRAFAPSGDFDRGQNALASFDLMNLMQRLRMAMGSNWPAEAQYRRLVSAMDAFVIATRTTGDDLASHGVAIYAPIRPSMLNPDYATAHPGQAAWVAWLQAIHAQQSSQDPEPVITNFRAQDIKGNTVKTMQALAGHGLHFTLQGTNILDGVAYTAEQTPQGLAIWAIEPFQPTAWLAMQEGQSAADAELMTPAFENGDNDIRVPYSGLHLKIRLGESVYRATVDSTDELIPGTIAVPCLYDHPSVGQLFCKIYFDEDMWLPKGLVTFSTAGDGSPVINSVQPQDDAKVTPLVMLYDAKTGEEDYAAVGEGTWGNGPELIPDHDEPGQYTIAFDVQTIGGASGRSVHEITVARPREIDEFAELTRRYFTPDNLIGTWRMHEATSFWDRRDLVPMDFTMTLQPVKDSIMLHMVWAGKNQQTGEVQQWPFMMLPESRLAPIMEYWPLEEGDNLGPLEVSVPAFVQAKDGRAVLVLQNPTSELLTVWVKTDGRDVQPSQTGGGVTGGSGSGNAPASGGASALQGVWMSGDGETALQIEGSEYAMLFPDGFGGWEIADTGRFEVQGNILVVQSSDGETLQYQFQVDTRQLVLSDGYEQLVFQRAE